MKKLSDFSRTVGVKITMTERDRERLDKMAGLINRSVFVRDLIDREYERRHPAEKGQQEECEAMK